MDFDAWSDLAERDPLAFEARRQQVLQDTIERISEGEDRRRLLGLQWRIDVIRDNASNPMAACVKLYDMMWDSVSGYNGLLANLQAPQSSAPQSPHQSATILPFKACTKAC
jgi:hypothetical protein